MNERMDMVVWLEGEAFSLPGKMPCLPGDGLQPRSAASPGSPWCPSGSPAPQCGSATASGTRTSHPEPRGLRRH